MVKKLKQIKKFDLSNVKSITVERAGIFVFNTTLLQRIKYVLFCQHRVKGVVKIYPKGDATIMYYEK